MATSRRVRVVVQSLENFVGLVIKKITLDITANLVAAPSQGGTPVDTNWARANWIPRIGSAATTTTGSREGVTFGQQDAGKASILGYKLAQGKVYISNNVPYIKDLNDGSSRQAPKGFIQLAVQKGVTTDLRRGFGR